MRLRLFLGLIFCLLLLMAVGSADGVQAHRLLSNPFAGPHTASPLQQPGEITQVVTMSAVGDPTLRVDWLAWQGGQLNPIPAPPAPSGWQTPGFNDSGWAATVATHYAPWDSLPFCNEIGGGTVAHPDGGINEVTYLVRKHFTIPEPPAGYALAEVRAFGWADNGAQVWLNGQFLGSWFMSQEPNCTGFLASATAPQVGDNVLAIQLSNNDERDASGNPVSVNPIGVAFQLEAVYRIAPTPEPPTPTPTPSVADLAVTKSVDDASPNEGDTIAYTITVTNNGPNTATNVTVTDALPAGLTFVSATPSQGSYDSATGVWSVGDLASGSSATLTLTATVDVGTAGSTITNTATAEADEADPDPGNNSGSADFRVPSADLAVSKTVDNASPGEGDTVNFTVTVTNNGPDTATDVTVTDALPAGLTFVSATPSQGSYDSATGVWSVGDLASGSSATLTLTAMVDIDTSGLTLTNTAAATADQSDPDPGNNSGSVDVTVPLPPAGTDKLSARVFIDDRCDGYFQARLDVPLEGVPVKVRFLANGATKVQYTTSFGLVYFAGFDSSGGVEVSVDLPASYRGYALGSCFNSPSSVVIPGSEFDGGIIKHKHVDFSVEVRGEMAGR